MILSRVDILREMEQSRIVISKFNEENLNPNSYDITLGNYFWRVKPNNDKGLCPIFEGPYFYEDGDPVEMKAGNTYLAITKEKIGSFHNIVGMLHAKSSTRRNGISICDDAGFGDVGYYNYWTMELTSNIERAYVKPGMKIGQVSFTYVNTPPREYDGQYQGNDQFVATDMVPRACRHNIVYI